MRIRGCGINVIIEGLEVNKSGVVTESAEEQIQKDIKKFLSEHGVPGREKKGFYTLLRSLYEICNSEGPYKLIKGNLDFIKGGVDKPESMAPEINVSLYEMDYTIKFLAAVNVKNLYRRVRDTFKDLKTYYKTFNADSFAITIGFSDNDDIGLYMAIEKESKGLRVRVGYQEYIIEATSGLCGTEIGLPIDKEKNEGTDVGGISTPSGGFSKKDKKKVFQPIIDEDEKKEGDDESDNDKSKNERKDRKTDEDGVERLVCPKCKSPNVNSDGSVLTCSDCSHSWNVTEEDEDIRDHMVPQDDDVDISDYQTSADFYNGRNSVECLQTQQNVDKSSLV